MHARTLSLPAAIGVVCGLAEFRGGNGRWHMLARRRPMHSARVAAAGMSPWRAFPRDGTGLYPQMPNNVAMGRDGGQYWSGSSWEAPAYVPPAKPASKPEPQVDAPETATQTASVASSSPTISNDTPTQPQAHPELKSPPLPPGWRSPNYPHPPRVPWNMPMDVTPGRSCLAPSACGIGGKATYYTEWSSNPGSCGYIPPNDNIVALAPQHMPAACGRCVLVHYNNVAIKAVVTDMCEGCVVNPKWIDLSSNVFGRLASHSQGVLQVDWDFVEC